MAIVTILAALSTVNTLIASIPRMLYGLAQEGQAPRVFAALSRWQTPWLAILLQGTFFIIPILIGIATIEIIVIFILASAFSWFVSYIIAHLDVIILRYKYPKVKREFKSPLWLFPQIFGILAMIYMMVNIFPEAEIKRQIYLYALIFLGLAAVGSALWVKLVMKKGLFTPIPLEQLTRELAPEKSSLPDAEKISGYS